MSELVGNPKTDFLAPGPNHVYLTKHGILLSFSGKFQEEPTTYPMFYVMSIN